MKLRAADRAFHRARLSLKKLDRPERPLAAFTEVVRPVHPPITDIGNHGAAQFEAAGSGQRRVVSIGQAGSGRDCAN